MEREVKRKKCFGMMDLLNVKCEQCNEETVIKCYNKTFGFLSSEWWDNLPERKVGKMC